MNAQAIHRFALFFMAAVAAVASSLWAQHDHAPTAQRTADTTPAEWLADNDARVSELIGRRVVNASGQDLGEVEDFVVSTGKQGTRAVIRLDRHSGAAEGRLVAVPLDALHIELSGEEARAVPQQARVRVELGGTPIEALPAYEYPQRGSI